MSNAEALRTGTARALRIIDRHISGLLHRVARELLRDAIDTRILRGHNMTGNTAASYAAAIYVRDTLQSLITPAGTIPRPLRRKLGRGERFHAGSQRWDGDTQQHTFTAPVATNGTTEAERSIAFLRAWQAPAAGWSIVICNGVEYATYQENELNIDTLTSNFDFARFTIHTMITPHASNG